MSDIRGQMSEVESVVVDKSIFIHQPIIRKKYVSLQLDLFLIK